MVSKVPESGATEEKKITRAATLTKCKVQQWKRGITKEKARQASKEKGECEREPAVAKRSDEFLNSDEMKERVQSIGESEEDIITLRR